MKKTYIIFHVTSENFEPITACYKGKASKWLTKQSNMLVKITNKFKGWDEAQISYRAVPFGVEFRTATEALQYIKDNLIKRHLEYLRQELRAERISYGELFELEGLIEYIEADDVELLQAAGVVEEINQ